MTLPKKMMILKKKFNKIQNRTKLNKNDEFF